MTEELRIGNYAVSAQNVYDKLSLSGKTSNADLKKLDKNGDKIITEDELVELEPDETDENSGMASNSEDEVLNGYTKQIDFYNNEIQRLEAKRDKAYDKMRSSKDDDTSSILSECQNYTNQIQNLRNNIYNVFVAMEEYEKQLEAQNLALSEFQAAQAAQSTQGAEVLGTVQGADNSTVAQETAANVVGSTAGTVSNAEFVNKFNNSSFKKGAFAGKGETVAKVAEKYDLDPNLLSSIMALETGWGTSSAVKNYNNPGGMMDPKTGSMKLIHYDTLEAGIEAVARNLKNNYINQGRTTIASIGAKYCPVGAANDPNGTNSGWVPNVTSIYNNLTGAKISASSKLA